MKRKLNFITFLIGIAVGISIYNSEAILIIKESAMLGYKTGIEIVQKAKESKDLNNELDYISKQEFLILTLEPLISYTMPDELVNTKNGKLLPMRIFHAMVMVPVEKKNALNLLGIFTGSIFILAGFIMVVFNFLRIIIAVNKSVIFEWINVKRLRRMGIGFVLIFITSSISAFIQNNTVLKLVEFENYKIINSYYDGGILMFGIISFLVAEIFAVGLKLREEQELTI